MLGHLCIKNSSDSSLRETPGIPHRKNTDLGMSANSFVIVNGSGFGQKFLTELKNGLIDKHYKTIFISVRSECSSYRVW